MGAVVHRKIAILGYPCVGKSSITLRYVYGSFPDGYETTIEDVHTKTHFFNGKEFDLEITDTAGQQEYSLFPRSVSVDVDGYILVYAIDDRKSFEIVRAIYEKLMENYCDRNTPLVLVGNKLDLQHNNRQVTTEEGKRLAASWDAAFHETSAKDNTAVQPIFDSILRKIEIANGNMRRPRNNCVVS